jgi:RND family efflux transporter MFP subunit
MALVLGWVQGGFHSKVQPGVSSPSSEAAPQSVAKVEKHSADAEVTVSGSVTARDIARIASRVQGYVLEVMTEAGLKVEKDQVLLRIDAKETVDRLAQAKAAFESATAERARTEGDFKRYEGLLKQGAISQKQFDDIQSALKTAVAGETRAKAAVEEAETILGYATVTAPFAGIVAERNVNTGDLTVPGKQLLSIYSPAGLELTAAVGEQYAPHLTTGETVQVTVPSLNLKADSSIREVVPQRDERTRTITVKATLPEMKGLDPGQYGTLTFRTRSSETLVIPLQALRTMGQLESAQVLEGGKTVIRQVKTGRKLDGVIEILSGLNEGETVVLSSGAP